jgi:hypothetical protein
MISLALAASLTSLPGVHAYRVAVRGAAGSHVIVAAQPPPGWTAAFCSARLCALSRVPVTIGDSGASYVDVHFYPTTHPTHGIASVTSQGYMLRLRI